MNNSHDLAVALVGGIGYLGYNLLYEHSSRGHHVYVIARKRSAEKRKMLVRDIERYTEDIILFDDLGRTTAIDKFLSKYGCPDIMYLVLGKLIGRWNELEEANAGIPYLWGKKFVDKCRDKSLIYISSILIAGKPLSKNTNIIVEEKEHLRNYSPSGPHSKSKIIGERNILSLCNRGGQIIVIRPGILIGRWCYHKEWRLLFKLASLHIRLTGGPYLHFVAARDIARIALLLHNYYDTYKCSWVFAAPWRSRIGDLHRSIIDIMNIKYSIPVPLPSSIPRWIPGPPSIISEYRFLTRYYIHSTILDRLKFKWTSLEDALRDAVEWFSSNY